MKGWILDLYPGAPGEMVVWLKGEDGEAVRLVDHWSPSMYVAADDRANLKAPLEILSDDIAWWRTVARRERVTDRADSEVVEVKLKDARALQRVAERIERMGPFGTYRLYNVDVPPNQSYLYEHDLFPLACCEVSKTGDRLGWSLLDDVWAYDYRIPNLRTVRLETEVEKRGRVARFTDPIREVRLKNQNETVTIGGETEAERILGLVKAVKAADPDFITTSDGDTFLLPHLTKRAEANGISGELTLDRDGSLLRVPAKRGTSYFQYGKIRFKPSGMKLRGRIHIDINTSFAFSEAGFEGLFELSRVCRMPLQTSSRASIGKALSSLQFYHASKMGLLVPWKPTLVERFKDRGELLVADRGGFIFEPKMGTYEAVAELDFASLYPNIMLKKNISAETVKCPCCPDSDNRVPELDWNVCKKRTGIVPAAIEIVVKKRLGYKELKKKVKGTAYDRYNARQAVLKWIGVTCLPGESPVFVRRGDTERLVRIGDFIDDLVGDRTGVVECPPDVLVAGIGQDYKAKYCRVAGLIKRPNSQRLLSVGMEDGRRIVTTPDHPFFALRQGELSTVMAADLAVGEAIPVALKIPSAAHEDSPIDPIERLRSSLNEEEQKLWRVPGEGLKGAVRDRRRDLLQAAISEGYSYQSVVHWAKSGTMPLRFLGLLGIDGPAHRTMKVGAGRRGGGRIAKVLSGDLGFVRVTEIKEIEECPKYVYCFQLAGGEVPGFFTGEGLIYTHNCFGYLGFNNAKFGRIDAHISVCAWDRKILVDAARVAERRGFEVIHGIVDSLWLKKEGAEERDYLEVKEEIRAETGFEISFEGIYKWIAFLPSKMNPRLPVLNRYFGAYRSGDVKVRGIEARRHDTPHLFKRCQMEVLEVLAKADTLAEARLRIPECVAVFQRYVGAIRRRDVPAEELAFSRDLSKAPGEYTNKTLQASVARQLAAEGVDLHAGEGIRYIIAERERGVPLDFGEGRYSPERYVELLSEACATVLQEFDGSYEKRRLMGLARGSM